MELNLSKMDYFFLYLTFPSTITLSLVNVESHIKCPGMRGFIASNDYEKYKKQKEELKPYYDALTNIKNTFYNENVFTNENIKYENMKNVVNDIKMIKESQTKFIVYHLSNNGSWSKALI
jgi:hypothetical protein